MHVLMLGWEYPPHMSGGLGTACEGLTRALAGAGVAVDFVVPALHGGEEAAHMTLIDSADRSDGVGEDDRTGARLAITHLPGYLRPYWRSSDYSNAPRRGEVGLQYGHDLFEEVSVYADRICRHMGGRHFDLIHAHDWMTFPAAVRLASISGKPFLAHVHSLEFDRAGDGANCTITAIEQHGLENARTVIAVSHYTKSLIVRRHGISPERIAVVHNGVYPSPTVVRSHREEKLVLFLGRITFQKGPEYFVEAARKVVGRVPEARFVMAGNGDMLPRMQELVEQCGLTSHFSFPGFLRGEAVDEMYARASVYVMPSVSEPFGIAPLEAINCETPVIISRQSGVAEVLRHALKADFWDIDRLAHLIEHALLYPELRQDMAAMASEEVKRIRWESAAQKVISVYRELC